MKEEKVRQPDFIQKGLMQHAFFTFAVLAWIGITLCLANYFYILESPKGEMAQIVGIVEGIFAGLIILYFILPWITWTMFTRNQKLEEAIEADQFFSLVNTTTKDRLHYIKQNKLSVFIAEKPLNDSVENGIKAAYYYFLTRFLPMKTNWYIALGQKRVCFDLAQVKPLIESFEANKVAMNELVISQRETIQQLETKQVQSRGNRARDGKLAEKDKLFWKIGFKMIDRFEIINEIVTNENIKTSFKEHLQSEIKIKERLEELYKSEEDKTSKKEIKLPNYIIDEIIKDLKALKLHS